MANKNELNVSVIRHDFGGADNFDIKAVAISSENKTGKFDILPGHANFICVIYNSITLHTLGNKQNVYNFKRGIVEVSENSVKLFLEGKTDQKLESRL